MSQVKTERIRDPVHDLIEFDGASELERTLWRVIQTPPFQRLRRIRQLGFSEFVFPGATHTRFAHSLGVFHTARALMRVIRRHLTSTQQAFSDSRANVAMAAALLHDVGHGMFSHAFEPVAREHGLPFARHEVVSERLIRDSEISEVLNKELTSGFANDVATLVARDEPSNLYDAVVSSQFDADRLDYMQRDRLMTGVQSSGVDSTWLLANLEVAPVPVGADEEFTGKVETLILGPKAAQTAESYVLALFHLYPSVYFHKAIRGAEMLFAGLMRRLLRLGAQGHTARSGLAENHPLRRFVEDTGKLDHVLALDDMVFWGALPMLVEAEDLEVRRFAVALRDRRLSRCIDVRKQVEAELPPRKDEPREKHRARVTLACEHIVSALQAPQRADPNAPQRILVDNPPKPRWPYKRYQDSRSPVNRILIRTGPNQPPQDMAELSPVIANAEPLYICRAYVFRDDTETVGMVENKIRTEVKGSRNATP
jgi:HD superfamily phosphohydrolase